MLEDDSKKKSLKKQVSPGEPFWPELISQTRDLLNSRPKLNQESSSLDPFNVDGWNQLI
jgi:hypothetical protein